MAIAIMDNSASVNTYLFPQGIEIMLPDGTIVKQTATTVKVTIPHIDVTQHGRITGRYPDPNRPAKVEFSHG